jgi:hypothetical protein
MRLKITLWLLIWLAASAPVLARTFWVKSTDVIQDSITAAKSGDTVIISSGLYRQNIFATKKIVILVVESTALTLRSSVPPPVRL